MLSDDSKLLDKANQKMTKINKIIQHSGYNSVFRNYFSNWLGKIIQKQNSHLSSNADLSNPSLISENNEAERQYYQKVTTAMEQTKYMMDRLSPLIDTPTIQNYTLFTNAVLIHGVLPKKLIYGLNQFNFDNLGDMISDIDNGIIKSGQHAYKVLKKKVSKQDLPYLNYIIKHETDSEYIKQILMSYVKSYKPVSKNRMSRQMGTCKCLCEYNNIMNEYLRKIGVKGKNQLTYAGNTLTSDNDRLKHYCSRLPFTTNIPLYYIIKPILKTIQDNKFGEEFQCSGLFMLNNIMDYNRDLEFSADNNDGSLIAMSSAQILISNMVILDNYFTANPKPTKACIQTIKKLLKVNKASGKLFID